MARVSESKLADLTGKAWRTISKRLADKGVKRGKDGKYDSAAALAAIYEAAELAALDLQTERARLAKWQADKTEQEVELRSGRMLDADEVTDWVTTMLSNMKSRLTQIPDATAQLVDPQHAPIVAEQVRRAVNEALEDLASEGERDPGAGVHGAEAASEFDGEPVGRSIPKALERKQRRARPVAN